MYRSILAVFICLSLLLASSDTAFALKDPGQIRVLPGTLPSAPKAGAEFNVAVPEMPPQYSKPISAALRADVTGVPYRNPSDCTPISYWDGTPYWYWPIPDDYGDDFFNMRFTPEDDVDCRLATVALCFYDAGSTVITGNGIDIILWDDDGYGFPGTELARINVPAADMIWFPWYVVVDFTPFDFHFVNQDFHVGFTTVDQANDVYAVLSDEGVLGTLRSSEYYLGMWGTMYNDWGLDVNFIIEADVCYLGPIPQSNCSRLEYGTFIAHYYWTIPDSYGDDFFNERFTNVDTNPGSLGTVCLNMHLEGSVNVTGEGIDVIVWDDDGLGYPDTELARVNVPTSQMVWYPYELEVDFRPTGLIISAGQDFHIGYTTVNQGAGNVMALLSDDGSGPAEYRSSEYWNGIWGLMIDDWGVDVDFLIAAELCFGDPPMPPLCDWIWYNGDAEYYWTIPDAYGDDYFNMRFTFLDVCTLMNVEIAFYAGGSVGAPGADFILFNSNGTYPTDTIAVYSVNPVTDWFPAYEGVDCSDDNIAITGDYHLGYTPIYNDPNDVLACLSDDGSMGTGRSSEWWGIWGLMVDDWGADVNFLMQVYHCCLTNGWEPCVDVGEWPTLAHDYHRTGYNPVEVGDLCGFQRIWDYYSPYDFCYFANPIIADEKVYAVFGVHLVCLDVYTGAEIWNTAGVSAYGNILGGSLRSTPTFEYGANDTNYIYFGGGTFESFLKADASTGQVHWYRGGIGGVPLEGTPGTMRLCPSVIIDDYIYFGGDGGYIYKLNKHTGSTAAFTQTLYGNPVWVSPSTDDTNLYFGCSASAIGGDAGEGNNEGALYKYDSDLNLIAPYSGNIGWDEGVTVGAAYNSAEDALYFQVQCAQGHGDPWNVDGLTQKADASTMGPHPDNTFYMSGLGTNANPAIHPYVGLVFFGHSTPRYRIWYTGISCMTSDMHPLWNDFTRGDMTNPAAVTCDGYVFWGTRNHPYGTFNCNRGYSGEHMLGYELTGYGFGPAIAKYETDPGQYQVFIAQTQLWSDCGTTGGRLAMYSVGEPRGRLQIPSREVVIDPAIDFTDPDGTERTAELFCNNGCAGLKYCLRLEADPAFPTRTFTSRVNPHRMARIEKEADKLIEYSIDDFGEKREWKQAMMRSTPMRSEIGDRPTGMKSRETYTASAPPSWVTMLSPDEGMVRVVDCYEATFEFEVSSMVRGNNWFYVWIATDDPDYNECELVVNDCSAPPYEVNTYVRVNAILGFAFCDGYLDFGDGGDDHEYVNNSGWFDDGTVTDAFTVDGGDDPLYEGSFYWAVDSNRVAWVEECGNEFAHLSADTVCTLVENMYMDEMYNSSGDSTSIFGDYFEAAVVDSIHDQTTGELDNALAIGMRLSYREWGAFGVPFNNFKLIAYDLCNRNSDPVTDLYWGLFADWDMPGNYDGYEQVNGDLSIGVAFQHNDVSGELAGYGTLPMAGSSLDGTTVTTGMYSGYGISNPDQIWPVIWPYMLCDLFFPIVRDCPKGDWCYHPNAAPGAIPDDRSMILTAGKKSFNDSECVSGAYVVFYYPLGISLGEVEDMMRFANKWAGYDRGDLNNDGEITLNDLVTLILYLNGGNVPYPFLYLADVDADGDVDYNDAVYFYNFFFEHGPYPISKLIR